MHRLLSTALLTTAMVGGMATPALAQSRDLDCKDFTSQAAAQANLAANPSDPNNLDANNNGQACETYTGPYKASTAPAAKSTTTKKQAAAATTAQLPRTGPRETAVMSAAGVTLLAAGSMLVMAGRRRPNEV